MWQSLSELCYHSMATLRSPGLLWRLLLHGWQQLLYHRPKTNQPSQHKTEHGQSYRNVGEISCMEIVLTSKNLFSL